MLTKEIKLLINIATREAKRMQHEYVCLEHLLYTICYNQTGKKIIHHLNGNIEKLINQLNRFFKTDLEKIKLNQEKLPNLTLSLQQTIERAFYHIDETKENNSIIGNLLASILEEEDSYASFLIQAQGITRLAILNYISHGIEEEEIKIKKDKDENFLLIASFLINMTQKAKNKEFDPLINREEELERMIHILLRRNKNNPILIGESGVGKTSILEGFSTKIAENNVPTQLKNIEIYSLNMGTLLAGTKFRGDFEERFKKIMEYLISKENTILFIDEIHTLVGTGSTTEGSMDAANLIKPFLSNRNLKCIGSTTYKEYKDYFEKDNALVRRFQKIEVKEPSIKDSILILEGLAPHYEKFHQVSYPQEILTHICKLSSQYIQDRFLPDKAIDVMDEVGAFKKLKKNNSNNEITLKDIETIIKKISKVPINFQEKKENLIHLEKNLKKTIFGQNTAIKTITKAIKSVKAGLKEPNKPEACFLFTGPTGVGKTELSKQLAKYLNIEFIRYDMSEYMEKHSIARLIGAPPGYIGYEKGGLLTDEIRKHPHSLILLDEIEKAHPDITNILLQIMDYGTLTDNVGRKTDFKNIILIMTSNAGAREMASNSIGFASTDNLNKGTQAIKKLFSPEFRNRLDDMIQFNYLNKEMIHQVINKFIKEINDLLKDKKIKISLEKSAVSYLKNKGFDKHYGARPIRRILQKEIKEVLTDEILFGQLKKGGNVLFYTNTDTLNYKINS